MSQAQRGFLKGPLWTDGEKEIVRKEWRPSDKAGSFARMAQLTGRPLNGVKFQAWKSH